MNSVIDIRKSNAYFSDLITEEQFNRSIIPAYQSFFARAATIYQKCLYLHSPCAEFWQSIGDAERLNSMVRQICGPGSSILLYGL